jgi:outer membrane protein assembly factor BamB
MTADAERVYISGGANLYAVNLETHAESWRFSVKANVFAPPVLTEDGQLIVGGYDNVLYSLNPATGVENWSFKARDRWIGAVLASGDSIYAPNADYRLYAFDLNGNQKWEKPFQADQSIWGAPVTDGKNVYFGTLGRWMFAVSAQDGTEVWKTELDGAILGTPVLNDGVLYVGLFDSAFVALDAQDGGILWQKPIDSWVWAGPVLVDEALYFGDGDGKVYAYSLEGDLLWKQELNGAVVGKPAVTTDGLVVATDSGNIYYLSFDGEVLRTASVSGAVYSSLLPSGAFVLVSPTDGENLLLALDENGAQAWNFTPAKK